MITRITDLEDPRVQVFSRLTEAQLRNRLDPSRGVFIAESPKVIRVALDAGYRPLSLLCEEKHIVGDASDIVSRLQEQGAEVYTGSRELLASLTGYTLTRGVLCAMHRPEETSVEQVLHDAHRVVVIDGVVDATNIGAIFRSAAALGIDAVLVTRSSCDPWNRRAIRVSMGSVFLVLWTWLDDYSQLRQQGFATCAMALEDRSIGIDDPILHAQERLAIIMGTEGEGLPDETIQSADYVVKIPMAHGVDSLNVAAAASVAFWELRKRGIGEK
jgi:tRNA G18 (ribose-2'-O)-methylase SpoU